MVAGNVHLDMGQRFSMITEIKFCINAAWMDNVFRIIIVSFPASEGDELILQTGNGDLRVGIVAVCDDAFGRHLCKLMEGMNQIGHCLKVIEVIGVDIKDNGDVRMQL